MEREEPPVVQIMLIWRDFKWSVLRNGFPVADYAYRPDAMRCARHLTAQAEADGKDCYMLERDKDGVWSEHACPRPPKAA